MGDPCGAPAGLDGVVRCSQCDPWAQDCTFGEKCAPWNDDGGNSYNATKCVSVDPEPKQPGEPCVGEGLSGQDDCDVGVLCVQGICVALCQGTPEDPICSEEGTACSIENEGVLILCLPL